MEQIGNTGPSPGGGSAAAASAALAMALLSMVLGISLEKLPKSSVRVKRLRPAIRQSNALVKGLLRLADADAKSYQAYLTAKKRGTKARQAALKKLIEMPTSLYEACCAGLKICGSAAQSIQPSLLSDLVISGELLDAAAKGAIMLIAVNAPRGKTQTSVLRKQLLELKKNTRLEIRQASKRNRPK
ncbi:MAG: cyclodeaminase/cyclohydrolase family protein [Candidatus Omnitrophica bacterium]|nr:cyclodeaminase/cyclohydrolase family protein [Candidatus Omnitrophota bacterium]